MLERALALSEGGNITAEDLQFSGSAPPAGRPGAGRAVTPAAVPGETSHGLDLEAAYRDLEGYLEALEKQIISKALEESRWNRTATAKLLGISFRSLRYRLKKLGLED